MNICIIGLGRFSAQFIPLFKAHPLVREVSVCDVLPSRLQEQSERFGIARCFLDYETVLQQKDIDAVAIFTQRWTHAALAIQALQAGKHVYSAVPAAVTLEELSRLVEAVTQAGLTYMMGETSRYYGTHLFCKERWEAGEFGRFVYGEADYLHDMQHFYGSFRYSGGVDWKKWASFPPMFYPTHSVSMILDITKARMTHVSCLGFVDQHEDGVFDPSLSAWKNVFSNQSALFRTSDGGAARINEFRRIGFAQARSVRMSFYGTEGVFEEVARGAVWTRLDEVPRSVEEEVRTRPLKPAEPEDKDLGEEFSGDYAPVHEKYRQRLPEAYREMSTGHEGSHQFLVDDFVTAVTKGTHPTVSVWDAARFTAPGLVAHASSLQGGKQLPIPDFGDPQSNNLLI